MAPVADALEHAHKSGVVHRDIKPANLLLRQAKGGEKPCLVVIDWGLAKEARDGAFSNHTGLPGTAAYRAPEVKKDGSVNIRSDVYSFGVILFEAHHNRLPKVDEFENATRPMSDDLRAGLDRVCSKCMEQEPSLRYGDMKEIALELDRITRGEQVTTLPIHPFRRRLSQINVTLGAAIFWLVSVSAVLLVCVLLITGFFRSDRLASAADAEALRARAASDYAVKDLVSAEATLNEIIDHGMVEPRDITLLSKIRLQQNRFAEASKLSEKAVLDDQSLGNRLVHAQCLTYEGKWEPALEKLNTLVDDFPTSVEPIAERCEVVGFLALRSRDDSRETLLRQCREDFKSLKQVTSNRNHARMGVAMASGLAGDAGEQIEITKEMFKANLPERSTRHFLAVGMAYGLCEDMPIEDQNEVLRIFNELCPSDSYYERLIRGMLLFRTDRSEEAIDHLKAAVKQQEKGGTPLELCFLAMCWKQQGHNDKANEAFSQAKIAQKRLADPSKRYAYGVDPARKEIAQPSTWHQVARHELCIAETKQALATEKQR